MLGFNIHKIPWYDGDSNLLYHLWNNPNFLCGYYCQWRFECLEIKVGFGASYHCLNCKHFSSFFFSYQIWRFDYCIAILQLIMIIPNVPCESILKFSQTLTIKSINFKIYNKNFNELIFSQFYMKKLYETISLWDKLI